MKMFLLHIDKRHTQTNTKTNSMRDPSRSKKKMRAQSVRNAFLIKLINEMKLFTHTHNNILSHTKTHNTHRHIQTFTKWGKKAKSFIITQNIYLSRNIPGCCRTNVFGFVCVKFFSSSVSFRFVSFVSDGMARMRPEQTRKTIDFSF